MGVPWEDALWCGTLALQSKPGFWPAGVARGLTVIFIKVGASVVPAYSAEKLFCAPNLEWAPDGGHRSGGGFDHLLGVLLLELHGAQVPECRVQPASVIDLFDEESWSDPSGTMSRAKFGKIGLSWSLSVVVT